MKRKTISKTLRFEVFKRDGFACCYCGKTPPSVTLEIDHITPVSKNGNNDINNLITSCFDCNRGKKNITLDKIPNKLKLNLEILKEHEIQIKEYRKFISIINKRINRDIKHIENIFNSFFNEYHFTVHFKESIRMFLKLLPLDEIIDAAYIAFEKKDDPNDAIKYFCGICWNKIRSKKDK